MKATGTGSSLNSWQTAALRKNQDSQGAQVPQAGDSVTQNPPDGVPSAEMALETFASAFQELSCFDQSEIDTNTRPGEVNVKTPSGFKSLRKSADGFVITIGKNSEASSIYRSFYGAWFEDTVTTYAVNEKTNHMMVRQETTRGSQRWSVHNTETQDYLLYIDLETGKSGAPSRPDIGLGVPSHLQPASPGSPRPQTDH
jgi:hypothetical protein